MKNTRRRQPPHPGHILLKHFIEPIKGLSSYRVAEDCHIPRGHFYGIVRGERGITAPVALRLGRYFGTSSQFWLNLQSLYELQCAEIAEGKQIEKEVRPLAA